MFATIIIKIKICQYLWFIFYVIQTKEIKRSSGQLLICIKKWKRKREEGIHLDEILGEENAHHHAL